MEIHTTFFLFLLTKIVKLFSFLNVAHTPNHKSKASLTLFGAEKTAEESINESDFMPLDTSLTCTKATCTKTCDTSTQTHFISPKVKLCAEVLEKQRHDTIIYRSLQMKGLVSPTVKLLCSCSIQSAVKSLLQNKSSNVRNQAVKGVCAVVKKECANFSKKSDSVIKTKPTDLLSFEVSKLQQEYEKETPFTWQLMSEVAENKTRGSDETKMTMAYSILFHSRSTKLNALQHVMSISLYNNELQKEGFMILSKLGITTSHPTLNNSLNKVKGNVDISLQNLKSGLEENAHQDASGLGRDDHAYVRHEAPLPADHNYGMPQSNNPCQNLNPGYRFNVDNLDFLIKVRDMTQDHQNQSKHYVQLMAIEDRINCEDLIDDRPLGNLLYTPDQDFLPSGEDTYTLRNDIIHVVAHVLIENVAAFQVFSGILHEGFQHKFSPEMAKKSRVVHLFFYCHCNAWNLVYCDFF